MDQLLFLACGNAMVDYSAVAVGDLAPFGVGLAAMLLHAVRFRQPSFSTRSLALILGALGGTVAGAGFGFNFKPSNLSLSTIPLLVALVGWLRVRGSLFPSLLRRERDPASWGFVLSRSHLPAAPLAEPAPAPAPAPAPSETGVPADLELKTA